MRNTLGLTFAPLHPVFAAECSSVDIGELEPPYTKIQAEEGARLDNPLLSDVSNLAPGDKILPPEDRKRQFQMGNRLWHSDSSYKTVPAMERLTLS